ncbi:lysine--tRNA ligase, partial [Candidatus Parcubacteria bacterium]
MSEADQKIIGKGTWIDKLAYEMIEREKQIGRNTSLLRVESGLGASGIPHIGSLGDAVRAYGVKLALEESGFQSELIAYSDDLDGLRKIPEGLPEWLGEHIAKPVSLIPDPFGRCHNSYGEHMSGLLLDGLDKLGIKYKFQRAFDTYRQGLLKNQIHTILTNTEKIGNKIAEMVGQEKYQKFLPYYPVCAKCNRLYTAQAYEYDVENMKVKYKCSNAEIGSQVLQGCGHEGEADISKDLGKLAWKVEFAARWHAFDIRFEAYGKDIMDSVKVNDWVSDEILGHPHPHHVKYEMFLDKGGKKISKSAGNVVTSQKWFRYGTPKSMLLLLYKRITGARELGFEDIPTLMDEYNELED